MLFWLLESKNTYVYGEYCRFAMARVLPDSLVTFDRCQTQCSGKRIHITELQFREIISSIFYLLYAGYGYQKNTTFWILNLTTQCGFCPSIICSTMAL